MALTKPAQAYVELWRAVCEKDVSLVESVVV